MEASSTNAENVHPLNQPVRRQENSATVSQAIVLIEIMTKILNARILAVLALLGALAMWIFTAYDPTSLRLWASAGYSLSVLCPVLWLYQNKGDQNG